MDTKEILLRIDLLIDAHRYSVPCPCPIVDRAEEARAAVAQLVDDAARYRFLRDRQPVTLVQIAHSAHRFGPTSSEPDAAIDAAIDALLKEKTS